MSERKLVVVHIIDNEEMKGKITLRAYTWPERIQMSKVLVDESPTDPTDKQRVNAELDQSLQSYERAIQRLESLDVTIKETGVKFESIDEMMLYEEGQKEVVLAANKLVAGMSLGKIKPMILEEIAPLSLTDSQATT